MAKRLSSQARTLCFSGPGFRWFGSWAQTWHHSSGHGEVASHIGQPEALTTRIYNYILGGFGEKKEKRKDWQRMLAQVPIFNKKEKRKVLWGVSMEDLECPGCDLNKVVRTGLSVRMPFEQRPERDEQLSYVAIWQSTLKVGINSVKVLGYSQSLECQLWKGDHCHWSRWGLDHVEPVIHSWDFGFTVRITIKKCR